MQTGRAHTGRRRNEEARRAILEAAVDLLSGGPGDGTVSVDAIAAAAGVGKQTIYRWWPSKGAMLLDALAEYAEAEVPAPDTGTLAGDLEAFLTATFRLGARPATAALLRKIAAEAQQDEHTAQLLHAFAQQRRAALIALARRGAAPDPELLADQAFGVLWYQLLILHAPLEEEAARRLAHALAHQGH
ncbi:TetR/AcrR family transcriptional regulator [Nonomuraea sp. NPDC050556]|uniref:TetR/AcrR family transcriptional regulator n=1 Tax=Nonomuraea sp. NPDC050556 TaxID=3364369 RepID=UPI0037B23263